MADIHNIIQSAGSLAAVNKEDALHRAFQLQPECVVPGKHWLLDMDCLNLRTRGGASRPDGLSAMDQARVAVVEIKLDITGKGPTSPKRLAEDAAKRMSFLLDAIGSRSIKRLRTNYFQRYQSDAPQKITMPGEPADGIWDFVYVLASRRFSSEKVVEDIVREVSAQCADLPKFKLQLVQLTGNVTDAGHVYLGEPGLLRQYEMGSKPPNRGTDCGCCDSQHLWVDLDPSVDRFQFYLRDHIQGAILRTKLVHKRHGWPIGMFHQWGTSLGDVAFEIDLNPKELHSQMKFGKRGDIYQYVSNLLDDDRLETLAEKAKVSLGQITPLDKANYLFRIDYSPNASTASIAESFAATIGCVTPWVEPYIW